MCKYGHIKAKVKVGCFSLISVAVLKYPGKNKCKEKDLFSLSFQVIVCPYKEAREGT